MLPSYNPYKGTEKHKFSMYGVKETFLLWDYLLLGKNINTR
jgi:hypothetical protein